DEESILDDRCRAIAFASEREAARGSWPGPPKHDRREGGHQRSRPWQEHRHPTRVGIIVLGPELLAQKTFFEPRLQIETHHDRRCAEKRKESTADDRGRDNSDDDTRVDRMTYQTIRSGVDDLMVRLARDGTGPESSEMNARPPCERQPGNNRCNHRQAR